VQVQVQVQVQVRSSPSLGHATQLPYSDEKVANRNVRDFGWKRSITRPFRPPIPLCRIVARTEGYTHAAKVWDLSIVQGPFLSPRAKP
jgi:hypothetical protein